MVLASGDRRHLVLVGGGHSHLHVLRKLAMEKLPRTRVTLVSPSAHTIYTGMVPGALAGLYDWEDVSIDLRALAARGGVRFLADRVVRLNPVDRIVECENAPPISYDVISIDIGSRPSGLPTPASPLLLALKPIEAAVARLEDFAAAARRGDNRGRVIVVGAGAGGVEVAFAVRARLRDVEAAQVTLIDRTSAPLPAYAPRVVAVAAQELERHRIEFIGDTVVTGIDSDGALLGDGKRVAADLVIWASGAEADPLLRDSGLPVDDRGFLRVANTLQCLRYPSVFAAGDCASLASYPGLPKAGVYAVRQGPVLWRNLKKTIAPGEGSLEPYRPQRDFLSLLSTGDGRAIASYYSLAARGRWVWRLKNWIDRRFVRQHAPPRARDYGPSGTPPPIPTMAAGTGEMCGGCAAKVSDSVLGRVLDRLRLPADERVVIGLEAPDDAAVVRHPPGLDVVSTADFFPAFADDPLLVGAVAAVNAASDLYAMGAEPTAALALVGVPTGSEAEVEETLELVLRGAVRELRAMDIALVGGHTVAVSELLVGFTMFGAGLEGELFRKAGAQPGDALVLTKPIGTGVVLAAARVGVVPARWSEAVFASMLQSNRAAVNPLRAAGVRACTDVTGFGLAGHLAEMLRASGVGACLWRDRIPALPGAIELLASGWRSSFHGRSPAVRRLIGGSAGAHGNPRVELLFDPQTSGGLLASVPKSAVEGVIAALGSAVVIGEIVAGRPSIAIE